MWKTIHLSHSILEKPIKPVILDQSSVYLDSMQASSPKLRGTRASSPSQALYTSLTNFLTLPYSRSNALVARMLTLSMNISKYVDSDFKSVCPANRTPDQVYVTICMHLNKSIQTCKRWLSMGIEITSSTGLSRTAWSQCEWLAFSYSNIQSEDCPSRSLR